MSALEIRGLKKAFGEHQVIKGLDLLVPDRSVFGLIGPNGSGKTSTMKMVLGLLKPDEGSIAVCGEQVSYGEMKTNRLIGYLPDVPEFYGYMKPGDYLKLCGRITGMTRNEIADRSEELLHLVGLSDAKRKIAGFSRGMKQRLGIAQALLNQPRLLICDEPTSALDPVGRKEVLDILLAVQGTTTVVFSTHILSDVERICDQIAVLHEGKIELAGSLVDLKARHTHSGFLIDFAQEADIKTFIAANEHLHRSFQLSREGLSLSILIPTKGEDSSPQSKKHSDHVNAREEAYELISLLADLHIAPTRFESLEPTLENLFMEVVK